MSTAVIVGAAGGGGECLGERGGGYGGGGGAVGTGGVEMGVLIQARDVFGNELRVQVRAVRVNIPCLVVCKVYRNGRNSHGNVLMYLSILLCVADCCRDMAHCVYVDKYLLLLG